MILVTGGTRSGKSRHAEALIGDSSQVLYIATSQILDDEMAARIEHHRQGRPAHWRTVERWQHVDELIHADINPHEAVLLECVTTMVTNLLFDYGGDKDPDEWDYQAMEQAINAEIQSLIAACQRCPAKVVLVTNEVGMGIVPESRLARHFRDIAGRVNQQLAAAANEVWLVVSGIGVKSMSKLFWAMLSFITRLPVRVAGPGTGFRALFSRYYYFSFNWIIAWRD